jgi:hypothetical protein
MNLEAQFEVQRRKAMIGDMTRDQLAEFCTIMIDENYALKSGMRMLPELLGGMIDGTTEATIGDPDELDEWNALLSSIG